MHQAWPLTQTGEVLGALELEVAAKRLLPRGYGEDYSMAVLDQLKAWEAFRLTPLRPEREPSYAYWGRHTCWLSPDRFSWPNV